MRFEDKAALLARAVAALREDLAVAQQAASDAHAGATHEDNKSEHSKDMRATEAQYVAAGQAVRAAALERELAAVLAVPARRFGDDEAAQVGALVGLVDEDDEAGATRWYLLLPEGGGLELDARDEGAATRVVVVTPKAPVGRALLGRRAGDTVALDVQGKKRQLEVTSVV